MLALKLKRTAGVQIDFEHDKPKLQNRFRGALLGVAIGDALGAPFEGRAEPHITELDRLLASTKPLRYTDDTHMTIATARSLLHCRKLDPDHLAWQYLKTFEQEPWRGYGKGAVEVFRAVTAGLTFQEAASQLFGGEGSFGNGAAMRIAPVALYAFYDLEKVAELARISAQLTHTHSRGQDGAAVQAVAIAYLLTCPRPLDKREFLDQLFNTASTRSFQHAIRQLESAPTDLPITEVRNQFGTTVEADRSVPTAIYTFLRHSNNFSEAIRYAVSLGGDTDTIASMTGALAGAYLGETGIPPAWIDAVEGTEELRELADGLLELALEQASQNQSE